MTRDVATLVAEDVGDVELLVLAVGALRCALRMEDVVEVVRAVAVAPLPGAPPICEGVIDVRGDLVPVLDLRRRVGSAPRAAVPEDHFVIARAGARVVALRADGTVWLARVPADAIRDASGLSRAEYVVGAATLADGLVVVTDLAAFLSAAESDALDRTIARLGARREDAR